MVLSAFQPIFAAILGAIPTPKPWLSHFEELHAAHASLHG
jgi:hypothetical protein